MCAVRAPSRDSAICVRTRIDADWQRTGPGPFAHGRPEIQVPAGAPRAGPRRVLNDRCVRPSGAVCVLRRHDGRLDRAVRGRAGRLAHGSRSGQRRRRRPAPARDDSHRRGPLRDGRRLGAPVRRGRRRPSHGQDARPGGRQRRPALDRGAPGGPQRLRHRSPLRQGPPVHDRARRRARAQGSPVGVRVAGRARGGREPGRRRAVRPRVGRNRRARHRRHGRPDAAARPGRRSEHLAGGPGPDARWPPPLRDLPGPARVPVRRRGRRHAHADGRSVAPDAARRQADRDRRGTRRVGGLRGRPGGLAHRGPARAHLCRGPRRRALGRRGRAHRRRGLQALVPQHEPRRQASVRRRRRRPPLRSGPRPAAGPGGPGEGRPVRRPRRRRQPQPGARRELRARPGGGGLAGSLRRLGGKRSRRHDRPLRLGLRGRHGAPRRRAYARARVHEPGHLHRDPGGDRQRGGVHGHGLHRGNRARQRNAGGTGHTGGGGRGGAGRGAVAGPGARPGRDAGGHARDRSRVRAPAGSEAFRRAAQRPGAAARIGPRHAARPGPGCHRAPAPRPRPGRSLLRRPVRGAPAKARPLRHRARTSRCARPLRRARKARLGGSRQAPPLGQREREVPHARALFVRRRPRYSVVDAGQLRGHADARPSRASWPCATSASARPFWSKPARATSPGRASRQPIR